MSKSESASSDIPDPMPDKSASLWLLSKPEPPKKPTSALDDSEERTIISAMSRDMLGLTDEHAAATKIYQVPRELLELARARASAQRASERPGPTQRPDPMQVAGPTARPAATIDPSLEDLPLAAPLSLEELSRSLSAPPIPTGLTDDPQVAVRAPEAPSTLALENEATAEPDITVSSAEDDAADGDAADDASFAKRTRKAAITKWVVLAGAYFAIVYAARIWLPMLQ